MKDTLSRRIRFAPPQPVDGRIEIGPDDIALFEAIHRHGPLPTHYLYALLPREKSLPRFQDRLTKLYNGTTTGSYLTRPPQQYESFTARYQYLVYDLHENAKKLIEISPFVKHTGWFIHQLMGSCITASIELACRKAGMRFMSRHEILSRKGNPLSLPLKKGKLVPDELFAIESDKGFIRIACEWDRATEPLNRKYSDQTDFGQKLAGYEEVMDKEIYKETWGISRMGGLIATTNEGRANSIREALKERGLDFKVIVTPEFASPWRMPAIYEGILDRIV